MSSHLQAGFKALMLLSAGSSYYLSLTPPVPPPKPEDKQYKGQPFEYLARKISFMSKVTISFAFFWDALMALSEAKMLGSEVKIPCSSEHSNITNILSIHPVLIFGVVTTILSSYLRLLCFRELGESFTFEVTIRQKHALITSGPYSYVRHPSYIGVLGNIVGALSTHLSPGSWNHECNGMSTPVGWLVYLYIFLSVFTLLSLLKRGVVEDRVMEDTFGKKWREYRRQVPYRFIPWVV